MQPDDFTVHIVDDEEALRKSLGFMLTVNGFGVRLHRRNRNRLLGDCPEPSQRSPGHGHAHARHEWPGPGAQDIEHLATDTLDHRNRAWRYPDGRRSDESRAVDFIEKPFEEAVIIEAVRRAAENWRILCGHGERGRSPLTLGSLSERERQILAAVVAGSRTKPSLSISTSAANRRSPSRQCDDEDEGTQPAGNGAHVADRQHLACPAKFS